MAKLLRVAMLSKWHVHAAGYANIVNNSGKAKVVCVWDEDIARGISWAGDLKCEFMPDLDLLLARDDIDAVVCDTPTTMHKEVIIKAIKAGKHVFTEKALCPTVEECLEVKEALDNSNVTFTISYPQRQRGAVQFAKQEIEKGTFGKVTFVRSRDAHSGVSGKWLPDYWFEEKDAAGGAMMDLGCHPMYLLAYLLGKPKRITAIFNSPLGSKVDENAAATIEFANGAIGVAETGFDSYKSPQMLEIYGTDATLMYIGGEVRFCAKSIDGYTGGNFITPKLPADKPLPLVQFIDACIKGTGSPEGLGIDDAIALTELLELAYAQDKKVKKIVRKCK